MSKTREKFEEVGNKILSQTRTELYLSMRFLGVALGSLSFKMDLSTKTIGTDAVSILYNPTYLTMTYIERTENMNRMYMHMLMHCVFRHMFSPRKYQDEDLWNISCDIAVESVLDSMDYPSLYRVSSDARNRCYEQLLEACPVLSAERIYQYFIETKTDPYMLRSLSEEFSVCDHSFWQRLDGGNNPNNSPDSSPENQDSSSSDSDNENESQDSSIPMINSNSREKDWEKNAKRIESDMEIYGNEASEDSGSLKWMIKLQNRKKRSYKEFLHSLAILREEVTIDLDSFDYGFYMYGLEHYGNMPLIEENEYSEVYKVEELVIAIDTSASCKDKLVKRFINETFNILDEQNSFHKKMNIHIVECDNKVQKDIIIESRDDLDKYSDSFEVSGGYGTDFRPVFTYVDDLRRKGELINLRGLMYFTDGFGEYPNTPTDYDTVFVFYEDEEKGDNNCPDWAIKMYLD